MVGWVRPPEAAETHHRLAAPNMVGFPAASGGRTPPYLGVGDCRMPYLRNWNSTNTTSAGGTAHAM